MIVLGLLIALAAAAFAAVVLAQNWGGSSHSIEGFGANLGSLTIAEIFLAGIILTAIFFMALWLAGTTTRYRRRAAMRRREESRSVREEREGLAADRDRLARELEDERARGRAAAHRADAEPGYAQPGYESTGPVYRDGTAEDVSPRHAPAYPDDPHDPAFRGRRYREGEADRIEPVAPDRDR